MDADVLDLGDNDVITFAAVTHHVSNDRKIIRFCCPGRKDYFLYLGTYKIGNDYSCIFQGLGSIVTSGV